MANPVVIKNFRDSYVSQPRPTRNYSATQIMKVGYNDAVRSFIYWSNPVPAGATITSAKLRLYNSGAWAGSVTLTVRPLSAAWSGSGITWNKQPGVRTPTPVGTLTKVGAANATLWEIDITDIMQSIANGAAWYGVRVTANGAALKNLVSVQGAVTRYRPQVEIQWSDNPEEPENLIPDDERNVSIAKPMLRYTFVDVSGSTQIGSQQIQLDDADDFLTPTFDSGWRTTDVAEYDLSTGTADDVVNPGAEVNTTGWTSTLATLARTTGQFSDGVASFQLTSTGAGTVELLETATGLTAHPVTELTTYYGQAKVKSAAVSRSTRIVFTWYTAAGAVVSTTTGPSVASATGSWTAVSFATTAPATAAFVRVGVQVLAVAGASEVHYVDDIHSGKGSKYWPGLTDGGFVWWRVKTKDQLGLESPWSDPAKFWRTSKGSLSVTCLGSFVDGGGATIYFVEDTTPPIFWTLTGRTQKAYQVTIARADQPDVYLYNSGKVTSTTNSIDTGPNRVLVDTGAIYRLRIWVWDTIDRVTTPGDPMYYEYTQDFIYQPAAGVTAPTTLAVNWTRPWPWVDLTFNRTTPPDSFTILRDGQVVAANIEPSDILVSGTQYSYRDFTVAPRVNHTWQVVANVNGQNSVPSNSVVSAISPGFSWLMESDGSNPIAVVKSASEPSPTVEASSLGFQEVHQPIGGSSPVLITQYISGFQGRVEGVLADGVVSGLDGKTMRDRFKAWKKNPGIELTLFMVDEVLQIVPYNLTYRPRAKSGGVIFYDISFDFFETGY